LAPTPTTMEGSERFLQAEDATRIAAVWRPFQYVWISGLPSAEVGIGLLRFTAGAATPGLYRILSSEREVMLEPFGEHD
jgi:hypothetical protein